jgi:dihydropteridine reductase
MKAKTSLIVGGSGQLGKHVVSAFKNKGWKLMSVDLKENPEADNNLLLTTDSKISTQLDKIYDHINGFSKQ